MCCKKPRDQQEVKNLNFMQRWGLVTDAIWVGTMNNIGRYYKKVGPEVQAALDVIINGQTNEIIHEIYARHRNNAKIKWKNEIKEIIGIPLAPKPGMDI
jgi:hypothetical protein